jgi:hypothetical protein
MLSVVYTERRYAQSRYDECRGDPANGDLRRHEFFY